MFYFFGDLFVGRMAVKKCKFCGIILQNELMLVKHCHAVHDAEEDYSDKGIKALSDVC